MNCATARAFPLFQAWARQNEQTTAVTERFSLVMRACVRPHHTTLTRRCSFPHSLHDTLSGYRVSCSFLATISARNISQNFLLQATDFFVFCIRTWWCSLMAGACLLLDFSSWAETRSIELPRLAVQTTLHFFVFRSCDLPRVRAASCRPFSRQNVHGEDHGVEWCGHSVSFAVRSPCTHAHSVISLFRSLSQLSGPCRIELFDFGLNLLTIDDFWTPRKSILRNVPASEAAANCSTLSSLI